MEIIMLTVGAFEAKAKIAELLDKVAKGEHVLITRRGAPANDGSWAGLARGWNAQSPANGKDRVVRSVLCRGHDHRSATDRPTVGIPSPR